MEEQPAAILKDEVGAVTLPQAAAAALAIITHRAGNQSGGQEEGTGSFAVVGNFHNIGCQGMQRQFHQRTNIKAADIRHCFIVCLKAFCCLYVIECNRPVPNRFCSTHPPKCMCPANIFTAGPNLAPLLGGIGTRMEIGMGCVNKLRLLGCSAVPDSLAQTQISVHTPLPPFSMG